MTEPVVDRLIQSIGQAAPLYHRLVMLVAPAGSGKTAALQDVHERTAAPLVNVNLELSRRMLDLTSRQRALQLPRLLRDVCASSVERQTSEVLLLDNIEIFFDVHLKQDPLRLLQGLSRNKTVVAAWNGEIRTEGRGLRTEANTDDSALSTQSSSLYLVYATPDHPEYRRYPLRDFLYVWASSVERQTSGGICGKD